MCPKGDIPLFLNREQMEVMLMCNGVIPVHEDSLTESWREILEKAVQINIVQREENPRPLSEWQAYRSYPARYVRTVHWSVTGKCNYRCRHCYMSAPDAKLGELSHEKAMRIAEEIVECGVGQVSLTGGEPLVRRDFFDIVDVLLKGGVKIITVYSNGKLITEGLLGEFEKRGIYPEFNMSYDGVGRHDWLRGIPDAEEAVEKAFLLCREHGFPTVAEMCIHKDNRHTLRESVNRLASWGCRRLKTNPVSNVGAWKADSYGQSVSMDELLRLYLDYIPQYYEDGMPLSLQLGGFFYATPEKPESWRIACAKHCKDADKLYICGHARMTAYISPEGRVLPCMALTGMDVQQQFPLVTELGLANCLNDSFFMDFVSTRASEYFRQNPGCAACEYAMECVGGCRASALDINGKGLLGSDPVTCAIFKGGWAEKLSCAMMSIRPEASQV